MHYKYILKFNWINIYITLQILYSQLNPTSNKDLTMLEVYAPKVDNFCSRKLRYSAALSPLLAESEFPGHQLMLGKAKVISFCPTRASPYLFPLVDPLLARRETWNARASLAQQHRFARVYMYVWADYTAWVCEERSLECEFLRAARVGINFCSINFHILLDHYTHSNICYNRLGYKYKNLLLCLLCVQAVLFCSELSAKVSAWESYQCEIFCIFFM